MIFFMEKRGLVLAVVLVLTAAMFASFVNNEISVTGEFKSLFKSAKDTRTPVSGFYPPSSQFQSQEHPGGSFDYSKLKVELQGMMRSSADVSDIIAGNPNYIFIQSYVYGLQSVKKEASGFLLKGFYNDIQVTDEGEHGCMPEGGSYAVTSGDSDIITWD